MTRELDRNASIHRLFESAGRSIPDLDGHNIRVAERRILWSKIAQQLPPSVTPQQVAAWEAAQPAPAPLMPPSVTPEQVAAWERAQAQPQLGQELAAPPPSSVTEQQLAQLTRQLATRPQTGAAHVQRPAAPAPTGAAHVQRQAPRPASPAPAATPAAAPMFDLRQTMQSPTGIMPQLQYTPGPGDPNYVPPAPELNYTPASNYTGASKNIQGLLKVADYLSKKKS